MGSRFFFSYPSLVIFLFLPSYRPLLLVALFPPSLSVLKVCAP